MSKSNICVVGLSKQFTDIVCQQLANKLDMFYANIEKLFVYELTDLNKVEEICGVDFLIKEQISIIKRTCSYDNTLMCIEYPLLNNNDILQLIKDNCLLIYLGVNKDRFKEELDNNEDSKSVRIIELDAFHDRDLLCRNIVDISIDSEQLEMNDLINRIIDKILEYYL